MLLSLYLLGIQDIETRALITAQLTRFDHHNIAIDILLPCVFAFLSTGIAFLYLGYSLHLMLVA